MGIFNFFKKENRAEKVTDSVTPEVSTDLLKALLSDESIDRDQAMEIPSINAAVTIISNVVSSLPIKLYQEGDEVREIKKDSRLKILNHDTGDTLTATQFWRAMIEDYYIGIGGYAFINKELTDYKSIHYIDNSYIGFLTNSDPIFKDYSVAVNGKTYSKYEFLKLLRRTKDGRKSIPLQEECRTIMSVAYYTLKYENTLVKKGGNKKGFLTSENQLTNDAITKLKQAFQNLYSNNTDNVVILNKGMNFKESSNSCVEMQLNENKQTNSTELAMILTIPIAIIRGNATQQDKDNFISYCVVPVLNDIEASLDRDLLTEQEKDDGYYFAFDTKELTRGNILDRYKAYELAYQNNFMQVDEIREKEDMKPLGFDFIKLGLDSVLYNPKTKEIYVANTDTSTSMDNLKKGGQDHGNGTES